MFTGKLGSSVGLVIDLLNGDPGGWSLRVTLHSHFWGINTEDCGMSEEGRYCECCLSLQGPMPLQLSCPREALVLEKGCCLWETGSRLHHSLMKRSQD